MRTIIVIFLLIVSSATIGQTSLYAQGISEYTITVNKQNPLRVFVKAKLETKGDTLYMNPNCPNYDYPEGWSTFINNLSVSSSNGKAIKYKYITKSKWYLEDKNTNRVEISYEIDLSFIQKRWDVGNEQAGHYDGKAIYLVSKALFIYPQEDCKSIVKINIPKDWRLTTAWGSSKYHTFDIPNRELLIENSLEFGDYYYSELELGAFDFRIALLGDAGKSGDLFSSTLEKVAKSYLTIFKNTPSTIYLITVFYAPQDDGESFYNSNTFTIKDHLEESNKVIWANYMAHELFHYWNSDLMKAASYADRQWFSEGTAEYYANLTTARDGIIDETIFRSKMEKELALYQNYRGWKDDTTSLLKAGENKGKYRFLVYNGGWAVAMALDITIMEKTNGKKTLDDFMNAMFDKYSTTPYEYRDMVKTASEVAGADLSDFFAKYVEGTELLPLQEYLEKLGYKMLDVIYDAEIYLIPQNGEQPLRNLWLRKNSK